MDKVAHETHSNVSGYDQSSEIIFWHGCAPLLPSSQWLLSSLIPTRVTYWGSVKKSLKMSVFFPLYRLWTVITTTILMNFLVSWVTWCLGKALSWSVLQVPPQENSRSFQRNTSGKEHLIDAGKESLSWDSVFAITIVQQVFGVTNFCD